MIRKLIGRLVMGTFVLQGAMATQARAADFPELVAPVASANENSHQRVGNVKIHTNIDVFYPQVDADLPVVVVVGGLNGVLPTVAYRGFLERIASHGVIVLAPNGQFLLANQFRQRAEELARAIDWLPTGLPRLLALKDAAAPRPITDAVMVLGHSSGAQAAVAAYELQSQRIAGVVLLDPVDGDPYHLFSRAIADGQVFDNHGKLLLLTTSLCDVPAIGRLPGYPSCCPEGISAQHFYDAFADGTRWWAQSVDYGHIDLLDDTFLLPANWMGLCKASDRKLNRDTYRDWSAEQIAGFAAHLAWHRPFSPQWKPELLRCEMRP